MISLVKKTLLVAAMLAMSACATGQRKSSSKDASANTVKITNMEQNHGGTGIIIHSFDNVSLVLTNSHVCGVVEEGGLVSGQAGQFMVTSYKRSQQHDLCLIKVAGNLKGGIRLAEKPPVLYYDKALVSGHPALLPNVKTEGHFSGRQPVQILVGFRPCTEDDMKDPQRGMACMFLGAIPIVKSFDAVLVTATIMPGSSGSGVYNSNMELSGVVFAGSSELGYAWIVPYEYVQSFLTKEAKTLKYEKPTNAVNIFGKEPQQKTNEKQIMQKLQAVCESPDKVKVKSLCELFKSQILM